MSLLFLMPAMSSCRNANTTITTPIKNDSQTLYSSIGEIPVPAGFHRILLTPGGFGEWLRTVKVKKNSTVYLQNGKPKVNQEAQFAVIDITVGNKDLQQCADAVMRLRAEYFYSRGEDDKIVFKSGNSVPIAFSKWLNGERYKTSGNKLVAYQKEPDRADKRKDFESYLETVFTYCGTYSLADELRQPRLVKNIMPGDVFIKAGSPGHAMIVVDVAENNKGEKVFMLAQSYMPAQDIHIVKNPQDKVLSPWYKVNDTSDIITPEWTFHSNQLKAW